MQRIVHIDRPPGILIQNLKHAFVGWIATTEAADFDALRMEIDGRPLPLTWHARDDIVTRLPGATTRGWMVQADIDVLDARRKTLTFDVLLYGKCIFRRKFLKSRTLLDERAASPLFFMHVPKAAGTALRQFVDHAFRDFPSLFVYGDFPGVPAERMDALLPAFHNSRELIYGHFGFDFVEGCCRTNPKVVVVLRRPDALVDSYRRFATQASPGFFDNPYTRHLAGVSHALPHGDVSQAHFDRALRRLRTNVFPVFAEHLQSFVDELSEAFGVARFGIPEINRNDAPHACDPARGMPARLQFDMQLYEAALGNTRGFFEFLDA